MSTYPTTLDTFTTHATGEVIEASFDNAQEVAISALEAKVGINSSAVTTSMDYKLSGIPAADKSASLAGVENLSNKSLTTGTKITLGTDATGDTYYRHTDGTLKRLAIGTAAQVLNVNSGVPAWRDETAVINATDTIKGVTEIATTAEITAGTATGGTGAALVVPASAVGAAGADKLVQYDGAGKLPAVDGSQLTGIKLFKNGTTGYDASTASGVQNIPHGLGVIPKKVRLEAIAPDTANHVDNRAISVYNGTTQSSITRCGTNGSTVKSTFSLNDGVTTANESVGVLTFDATNIIITWTKNNSPTGSFTILWEAEI